MALLVPDAGERGMLDLCLSDAAPEAQTMRLYSNDVTPAEGDTTATYTEATIAGYSAFALARATWGAASTAAGVTSKSYPAQLSSFIGTGTIVGYLIIKATALTILWAERVFNTPGQVFNSGDSLTITPKIQLD